MPKTSYTSISSTSRRNPNTDLTPIPIPTTSIANIASCPPSVSVESRNKRVFLRILWSVIVPGLFLLFGGGLSLLLNFSAAFTAQPGVYANPEVLDAAWYATLSWLVGVISGIWFGRRILAEPKVPPRKLIVPGIGLLLAVVFFGYALVSLG